MRYKFGFDKNRTNSHGTERKGESWNKQMVRGWKLKLVTLEGFDRNSRLRTGIGKRLILYIPDGSWWNFDVYRFEE